MKNFKRIVVQLVIGILKPLQIEYSIMQLLNRKIILTLENYTNLSKIRMKVSVPSTVATSKRLLLYQNCKFI